MIISVIWLVIVALAGFCSKSLADYANVNVLQPNGLTLYWDYTSDTITGELHAVNANWVVFGLQSLNASSSGNTDWIVAWLNKTTGIGHFSDRYSLKTSSSLLQKDDTTNWLPLDAYFEGMHFVVKFSRPIMRCDATMQDINVEIGAMTARFAMGSDYSVLGGGSGNISLSSVSNASLTLIPMSSISSVNIACPTPAVVPPFDSQPTSTYANYAELMPYTYRFYWNFSDTSLTGEIHVKTSGWVGFGLSPNGDMANSDVIIGWITSDGHVNFTDRHIDTNRNVMIDAHQDWQLLFSREQNGYTVFKFTRLIQTCDSEDREIEVGSPHVIFAFGDTDPDSGSDITYHGFTNRGNSEVLLISSTHNDEQTLPSNIMKLQFSFNNVILPSNETYYYNEVQNVPDLMSKMHILRYDIVLPTINRGNMHHILVYQCSGYTGTPVLPPGDSTTSNIYDMNCQSPLSGWAIGGSLNTTLPKDIGIPIGKTSGFSYIRLELHYNNPNLDFAYIDFLTLTFYVTSELRKYDAGMVALSASASPIGTAIPPGEAAFNLTTNCYNSCFQPKMNRSNITVFLAIPHTHLTGLSVSTRLIRSGKDIGFVFNNPNYDFNFQQTYAVNPPVVITPDDELITSCIYNTTGRKNFTYGGFGTKQEMCIQYLFYYPRLDDFGQCGSIPDVYQMYLFVQGLNRSGLVHVDPLTDISSIIDYINDAFLSVDQTSPLSKQAFEQFNLNHSNNAFCGSAYDGKTRAPITPTNFYTPPDTCSVTTTAPPLPVNTSAPIRGKGSLVFISLIILVNAFEIIYFHMLR